VSRLGKIAVRNRQVPRAALEAAESGLQSTELAERRTQLAREFAELQWDLGGLAYEMAARDHFRLDVLVRRAARLQEVDAELGEVERLLHLEEAAAGGTCRSCGALHARGATFCWQCGANLLAPGVVRGEAVS
jgi:hypothetical protein